MPTLALPAAPPSTQPRLCAPKKTKWEKADMVISLITKEFHSLGHFLEVLFHCRDFSVNDLHSASHKHMVTLFLGRESNIGMGQIIDLIYHHPQSRPVNANPESGLYLSLPGIAAPAGIKFAQPALLTWAINELAQKWPGKLVLSPRMTPITLTT
ncbi:hypothetical protein B0H13DRAFT_1893881 [Mycena leptocephala]|nr:hypothetical protein B0H13DRAFT_1893881 [Mycena leptocephala]